MTTHQPANSPAAARRARPLGLPFLALVGLAALGVPRVALHDLHLIPQNGVITWLLALLPPAIWITVAVAKRVPRPFLMVFVTGVLFGAMLVITHQIFWNQAFDGDAPPVGALPDAVIRLFAIPSGLFTGAAIGAIAGVIAWGIQSLVTRSQRS